MLEDLPSYIITTEGKVINKKTGLIKKTGYNWAGYEHVQLYFPKEKKTKPFSVHRLVARVHIPNPDNLPQVHHIDHNPTNNHLSNLMWVTAEDNYKLRKSKIGLANKHKVRTIYVSNEGRKIMPKGFKTINVNDKLYDKLGDLAEKTAEHEGLSKVSLSQMIERMVKVYEDKLVA